MTQKERDRITILETKFADMEKSNTDLTATIRSALFGEKGIIVRLATLETRQVITWGIESLVVAGLIAVMFKG